MICGTYSTRVQQNILYRVPYDTDWVISPFLIEQPVGLELKKHFFLNKMNAEEYL
jgi:hypothetical protein